MSVHTCIFAHGAHGANKKWYENDVFISSLAPAHFNRLQVVQAVGADHRGKSVHLSLPGDRRRAFFKRTTKDTSRQPKLRIDKLLEVSEAGATRKAEYERMTDDCSPRGDPEQWSHVASQLVHCAEAVVCRQPQRLQLPVLGRRLAAVAESRERIRRSYAQVQEAHGHPDEPALREQHKILKRYEYGQVRRWQRELVGAVCKLAEQAMNNQDMRRFYKSIRELGIWLSDDTLRTVSTVTARDGREHFLCIGGSAVEIPHVSYLDPPVVYEYLGDVPGDEEVLHALKTMRESAAGADEVSVAMIRLSGPRFRKRFCELLQTMWRHPEEGSDHRDEASVRALVVLLWKGKGSRTDLDKHRGICLLSIVSRVIARLLAVRLAAWAEEFGVLVNTQYGFRRWRSTRDAILICRTVSEMVAAREADVKKLKALAAEPGASQSVREQAAQLEAQLEFSRVIWALIDIKKAYPSGPHEHCWAVLRSLGLLEHALALLRRLHCTTVYRVRTSVEESEPYKLHRGLREGCPSSCIVYNLSHDRSLPD